VTEFTSGAAPPPAARSTSLDQLSINTVRTLAMDAVQQADSGHPGTGMALERFGASAPYQRIYQELGLTVENVVAKAKELLNG
jgi:transketolase